MTKRTVAETRRRARSAANRFEFGEEVTCQRDPLVGSCALHPDLKVLTRSEAVRTALQGPVSVGVERRCAFQLPQEFSRLAGATRPTDLEGREVGRIALRGCPSAPGAVEGQLPGQMAVPKRANETVGNEASHKAFGGVAEALLFVHRRTVATVPDSPGQLSGAPSVSELPMPRRVQRRDFR